MTKFAIIKDDQITILPPHGAALVFAPPGKMQASGTMTVTGKEVCLEGDEANVMIDAPYIAPPYVIPGQGKVIIKALAGDQLTKKTQHAGKPIILQGVMFDTEFQVTAPAQQPTPTGPVPDGTPKYNGKGQFITTNTKYTPA